MRQSRWHTSPGYYALIATAVRQQLRWAKDARLLRSAWERLQALRREASDELDSSSRMSLELVAVELQCVGAAAARARELGRDCADIRQMSLRTAVEMFSTQAMPILEQSQEAAPARRSGVSDLVEELARQFQPSDGEGKPEVTLFPRKLTRELPSEPSQPHDDLTRPATRLRHTTHILLAELASEGLMQEVLLVLSRSSALIRLAKDEEWLLQAVPLVLEAFHESLLVGVDIVEEMSSTAKRLRETAMNLVNELNIPELNTQIFKSKLEDSLGIAVVFAIPRWCHWKELPRLVEEVHRRLGWREFKSEKFNRALVHCLCKFGDAGAVAQAIEQLSLDFGAMNESDAPMLTCALRAATDHIGTKELRSFLRSMEGKLESIKDFDLRLARLHASAKLNDGYSALVHLRMLDQGSHRRVELSAFSRVVSALQSFEPHDEPGENIVMDPKTSCEYIRELMLRQGHPMKATIMTQLLGLFTKAAKRSVEKNIDPGRIFAEALVFCEAIEANQGVSLSNIERELIKSGLIKMFCVCGELESALKIVNDSKKQGIVLSAVTFEPIIYLLCCVKLDIIQAEDVLTGMLNNGLSPSTPIVDSFVKGYIYSGDFKGALDIAQDLFNQHNVRPSIACMRTLLKKNLESADVFESRRVVMLLNNLGLIATENDSGNGKCSVSRKGTFTIEELDDMFANYGHKLKM